MRSTGVLIAGLIIGSSASTLGCSGEEDGVPLPSAGQAGLGGSGGVTAGNGGKASGGASGGAGAGAGGQAAGSSAGGAGGNGQAGKGGGGGSGGGAGGTAGRAGTGGGAGTGAEAGDTGEAPPSDWVNATGNLAGMESDCGNLTLVSATPGSETVIAGVAAAGLFASTDRGTAWSPLGTGSGSATITNRPSSIVYDPEDARIFWESGIYDGGGVFTTTDSGETFEQLGNVAHNDLVSIDFTDPERMTLLAGGHEEKQTLHLSTDGGENFEDIGQNLPDDSHFSSAPLVLDGQTFLVGSCGYGDGECGVYRSTDAGVEWERVSELPVAARPLLASDGTIYWTIIYNGGLARSTDDGSTWSQVADNLVTSYPVQLPDGRILLVRGNHVVVSSDQGENWTEVGEEIPFDPQGVTYSVPQKTLFVWHNDCGDVVPDDAIMSAGFDYTRD